MPMKRAPDPQELEHRQFELSTMSMLGTESGPLQGQSASKLTSHLSSPPPLYYVFFSYEFSLILKTTMCACVCLYVHLLLEARGIRSSGARIAGSCEHPVRMLGSEFSPLEAVCALNHRATSADPLHSLNH